MTPRRMRGGCRRDAGAAPSGASRCSWLCCRTEAAAQRGTVGTASVTVSTPSGTSKCSLSCCRTAAARPTGRTLRLGSRSKTSPPRRRPVIRCGHILHRDWAHPGHICTGAGLAPATSAPGLGSPLPHLRRDFAMTPPGHRACLRYRRVKCSKGRFCVEVFVRIMAPRVRIIAVRCA
jgi:hypothetical protein